MIISVVSFILFGFFVLPLKDESESDDRQFQEETENNYLLVMKAIYNCKLLRLILPFQMSFGLSIGFTTNYVNGIVVKENINSGAIGVLSALGIVAGVLQSFIVAGFGIKDYAVMVSGCFCFLFCVLPFLFFSAEFLSQWKFIVFYYILHGFGRGIWENTNKAVVSVYFNKNDSNSKYKEAAFASIYFASGLAGAVGHGLFQYCSIDVIIITNILMALLALWGYHKSHTLFNIVDEVVEYQKL